jgi:hypothetical protein
MPDEAAAMLRPHGLGWGTRRIAAELGCDRETAQRWPGTGRGWKNGSAVTAATRT